MCKHLSTNPLACSSGHIPYSVQYFTWTSVIRIHIHVRIRICYFLQNFHLFQAVPESDLFAIPYRCTVFLLGPPWRFSKLQEKPISPEMEFLDILGRVTSFFIHVSFSLFLWIISRILRISDLGSVSAGPIESASNLDQDPVHCLYIPYLDVDPAAL